MSAPKDNTKIPSWLKRIQEGSWEPEILISGIVLFGLFKIYPLIGELNYFLEMNSSILFTQGDVNEILTAILRYANIILIIGFLSHILFRSVWVAFVGLSYVYKKGIRFKRLKYPKKYLNNIQKSGNYSAQIIRLEEICSVIFAVSFLLFMWVFGLSVFFSIISIGVGLYRHIYPLHYNFTTFVNILIILCLIVFIDFVTLGGLRRIPYVRKAYYPLYKIAGWLTLSFLYRNIYYGIISNHKKWKVSITLIIFSIITIFLTVILISRNFQPGRAIVLATYSSNEYRLDESKYRNKVSDGMYSKKMHISDYAIDKTYLELFIVHTSEYEQGFIVPACNYDSLKETTGISYDSLRMACLEKFYDVALDGNLLEDAFIYQRNSQTGQDGLLSIIDLTYLEKGKHRIDLYYNIYEQEKDTSLQEIAEQIYFYKVNAK